MRAPQTIRKVAIELVFTPGEDLNEGTFLLVSGSTSCRVPADANGADAITNVARSIVGRVAVDLLQIALASEARDFDDGSRKSGEP